MKRIVVATLLVFGAAFAAHADNDVYVNTMKRPRDDAALQSDTNVCAAKYGAPQNGAVTAQVFKRCMLARGWRFSQTVREQTWVDPETGLTCRHGTFLGVASQNCSNY